MSTLIDLCKPELYITVVLGLSLPLFHSIVTFSKYFGVSSCQSVTKSSIFIPSRIILFCHIFQDLLICQYFNPTSSCHYFITPHFECLYTFFIKLFQCPHLRPYNATCQMYMQRIYNILFYSIIFCFSLNALLSL